MEGKEACSTRISNRSLLLILPDQIPLDYLQSAHLLLLFLQLVVQHKAFLVQVLQCFLPCFTVKLFAIVLPAAQGCDGLPVVAKLMLIPSFKSAAFRFRQFL